MDEAQTDEIKPNDKPKQYKSYRVEATPIQNTLIHVFVIYILLQAYSLRNSGSLLPFSSIWSLPALIIVAGYYAYQWLKFKKGW